VVHPDFRLRGGGTMLVRWGITVAEGKGWPVTLCASPMGRFLYDYLGFEKISSEVVQVEGEEETLTSTVMVYGAGE
jgi:predicted N-acetyltransferase YhbS